MRKAILILLLIYAATIEAKDFRFALITDIHVKTQDTLAYNDLRRSVDEINRNGGIDFVLVTGDLTESGDRASLLRVKEMLDKLKYKYYAISGNHETKWSESGATDFGHIFGSERFKFDHKGYKFLGFATGPVIRMMDGHVAPQDIKWLKEELGKNPQQPTILVTHYPLLPNDVDNWYEVTDSVRKYNIKAFLGGHYHSNRLFFYDGIPAFICRSNLRDKADNIGGYSLLDVRQDSIIVYEKKIGQDAKKWGGYSLTKEYYTADTSQYPRPDYSDNKTYSDVREVWVVNNGNTIYAAPYVYQDRVYVSDDRGAVTCYSLRNGAEKWKFTTGNRIVSNPTVSDNILIVGSADKHIYGLDASSGNLLWKIEAEAPVLGVATIDKQIAYIGASDHKLRAIDIKTGKIKWEYTDVTGYIETRPLVYEDKVIFGAWDGNLYALSKSTGKLLWKWQGGRPGIHFSPAAVWPVTAHNKVFVTAPDRFMSAINAHTGETVWRTGDSMVRETIGLSEDQQRIYSKTMQDSVVCYSAISDIPERIWATNVGYGYDHAASMPVEKEGVVFGSTKNGIIFALDGKSGKLLWKHKNGNSLISTVFPLNGKECVFTTGEGKIGLLRYK